MKKLLFFCAAFLFVACNSETSEESTIEQPIEANSVLTENEAVAVLNEFITSIPQTRSLSSLKIIGCTKRKASDFSSDKEITTRASTDNIDINSVPVYEITTDSDEGYGFGLVLGDKRFNEVIAFSPEGSLSDTIFNEGLAAFAESIPFLIYNCLKAENEQKLAKQTTRSDYWQPEHNFAYITEWGNPTIVNTNSYEESCALYPNSYTAWDTYDTPVRYVPVKWHQEAPYNNKVEHHCEGVKAKVGCGAIALSQIMAYHKHPNRYNWSLITYSSQVNPNYTTAVNEVSKLLIDVATATNTRFECKFDGLGGSAGATYVYFYIPAFEKFGYTAKKVTNRSEYVSSDTIRNGIVKYGPLLMVGEKHILNGVVGGGHAWVVDGFYKKSRYYRTISYGSSNYVSIYRQHFVTIHCNWGWGGSSDGWYYNFTPINEKYSFYDYFLFTVTPNT